MTIAPSSDAEAGIFAANRASGGIALAVDNEHGRTRGARLHEHGSLRLRFPNTPGKVLDAVLINTAGGMAGGDDFSVALSLGPGAALHVTTAAAEKIYRTTSPHTVVSLTIDAAAGSRCFWLPQETILFDQARLSRKIDVDLVGDAEVLIAEAVIFGRSAMGETVRHGVLFDRWRVRHDGRLLFAESTRLNGAIGELLARPAVAAGGVAIATVLIVPADDSTIAPVRAKMEQFTGEVAISAWNGMALARLCARDGAALRHDLALVLSCLGAPASRLRLQ